MQVGYPKQEPYPIELPALLQPVVEGTLPMGQCPWPDNWPSVRRKLRQRGVKLSRKNMVKWSANDLGFFVQALDSRVYHFPWDWKTFQRRQP